MADRFLKSSTASKAVAAAGDYAAGDVLSESATNGAGTAWRFSDIAPASGRSGTINGAMATCDEDSVTFRLRVHLFSANPSSSELDDNAAKNFNDSDRANYVGYIDLPAMADVGGFAVAKADQQTMPFVAFGSDLWGVVETLDAETNETAGMTLSITLHAE